MFPNWCCWCNCQTLNILIQHIKYETSQSNKFLVSSTNKRIIVRRMDDFVLMLNERTRWTMINDGNKFSRKKLTDRKPTRSEGAKVKCNEVESSNSGVGLVGGELRTLVQCVGLFVCLFIPKTGDSELKQLHSIRLECHSVVAKGTSEDDEGEEEETSRIIRDFL